MRVILEAELFQAKAQIEEYHGKLLALFQLASSRVHTIEVERRGINAFEQWLDKRDPQTRRACHTAIIESEKRLTRTPMRRLCVAAMDTSDWESNRLTLADTYRLLQQPLVLLLENAIHDRNFLETMARIASNGKRLRELLDERLVAIAAFGGVESNSAWIQDHRRRPEELMRLFVLSDSDAKEPWRSSTTELPENRNPTVNLLANACRNNQIPIHVLTRRAIENYLPMSALRIWGKRRTRLDALETLCPEQRHHYHMKRGFAGDRNNAFYATVPEPTMQALDQGIDKDIAEIFSGDYGYLQERWFVNDQQLDEAQAIVNSILRHL